MAVAAAVEAPGERQTYKLYGRRHGKINFLSFHTKKTATENDSASF